MAIDYGGILEHEYKRYFDSLRISRAKLAILFAIILVPLGIVFDYFIYPQFIMEIFKIRILCSCLITILYVSLFFNIGKKHNVFVTILSAVVIGSSIILMTVITEGYKSPYYAGLILIMIAYAVVLPWNVKETFIASFLLYSMYIIITVLTSKISDFGIFVNNNYFLLFTVIMVLVSSYFNTKLREQEFFSRFNLEKANIELQSLDKLKSEFFSNVSHEIRTPLTSIIAPIESFLKANTENKENTASNMMQQVHRNSLRLLKLVNDLLDFSKLEAGKAVLNLSVVDMENYLNEIVESIRPLAENKKLKLDLYIDEDVPLIKVDLDKIEKVFLNLLSNSIKFTNENGYIKIYLKKIDNNVIIEVKDTGIGMTQEDANKVFERFRQADGSSTRQYEGTGIGLTLAKEFTELHKGRIWIESELGKGSSFFVELPISKDIKPNEQIINRKIKPDEERRINHNTKKAVIEQSNDDSALQKPDGELEQEWGEYQRRSKDRIRLKMADLIAQQEAKTAIDNEQITQEVSADKDTIVVIEDSLDLLSVLKNLLSEKYNVITATDGNAGLEKVKKMMPHLVLSDLMLPGMDGYDLVKNIRLDPETAHIPVLILTAKAELSMKIKGLEHGADDYLTKPFNPEELAARVKSLINVRKLQFQLKQKNEQIEKAYKELKEAESQLIHTEKIKSLGILMMGLAHEMNNPLGIIYGGVKLLKLEVNKLENYPAKKEIVDLVNSVEVGLSRCYAVMEEIRKFAKKDKLTFAPADIRENIDSTLVLVNHLIAKETLIVKEYKSEKKVECVPAQISQVILNFVINSIQAIKNNGKITIATWDDNDTYYIKVADSGEGIDKVNLDHIFDPFFTTKDPNQGIGLGLSVCYKIIRDHNGKIDVSSVIGKGTEVLVSLPIKQKAL
ncbi:MAG: ATP-binding protein [bacterium]